MALLKERCRLWTKSSKITDPNLRKEFELLAYVNDKVRGTKWVSDLGYATIPSRLYSTIAAALQDTRLDRFVLKPAAGHSSHGVYLLKRDGLGGYICDMTGRSYASDEELVDHYASIQNVPNCKITEAVILEEYVNDSQSFLVPLDYKVYAFPTGTPLIMQRYGPAHLPKSEWGFEFYNETGARLVGVRADLSSGEKWNMRLPCNFGEIVETAKGIISATPVSFVRIDLYSTPGGVVFGEFTPKPNNGKGSYTEPYNSILGDHWARSLQLMGIDYPLRSGPTNWIAKAWRALAH